MKAILDIPLTKANTCVSFSRLFVEKLPSHRDYHQCAVPEKQDIIKVGLWFPGLYEIFCSESFCFSQAIASFSKSTHSP